MREVRQFRFFMSRLGRHSHQDCNSLLVIPVSKQSRLATRYRFPRLIVPYV